MIKDNRAYKLAAVLALFMTLIAFSLKYQSISENEYMKSALLKTLATYSIVRGVNAAVSLFKGSELNIEPAGVGATLAVGELLDPLDDLTERISALLLFATLALGFQVTIMQTVGSNIFCAAAALALISLAGLVCKKSCKKIANTLLKWALILSLFAIFLPISLYINNLFYQKSILPKVEKRVQKLESMIDFSSTKGAQIGYQWEDEESQKTPKSQKEPKEAKQEFSGIKFLESINWLKELADEVKSYIEKAKSSFDSKLSYANEFKKDFENLKKNLNDIIDLLVSIGTLYLTSFLFQILILPLIALFAIYKLYRMELNFY